MREREIERIVCRCMCERERDREDRVCERENLRGLRDDRIESNLLFSKSAIFAVNTFPDKSGG